MFWGVHLDKFVTYVKDPEILLLAGVQSQSCQSPESRLFPDPGAGFDDGTTSSTGSRGPAEGPLPSPV